MTMSKMTNFTEEQIQGFLDELAELKMVWYCQEYIIMANRVKYNSESLSITQGFCNLVKEIPVKVIEFAVSTKKSDGTPTRISEVLTEIYRVYPPSPHGPPTIPLLNLSNLNLVKSTSSKSKLTAEKIPDDEWDERFSLIFEDIEDDYGLSNIDTNKLRAIAGDKPGRAAISDLYLAIQGNKKVKKKGAYLMKSLFSIKK